MRLGVIDRALKDQDMTVMSLVIGVGMHEPPALSSSLLEFGIDTRAPRKTAVIGQDSDRMILKLLHLLRPFRRGLHHNTLCQVGVP